MKTARQAAILDIIRENDVETQGQLLDLLQQRGVKSTQATVSRDIKDMNLVKEASADGHYRYVQSDPDESTDADRRLQEIFREGCLSFDHALHTVVIKTLPGLASAVCSAIDATCDENVLGTVAGDDTGILIMRNAAAAERLCIQLRRTYKR